MKSVLFTALFCSTLCLWGANSAAAQETLPSETPFEDCNVFGAEGAIVEYECINRNVARKESRLQSAFGEALDAVAKTQDEKDDYMQDSRRSPVYLEWSQAAWKDYAEQNCTVIAGLMGGSNAWISRYWTDCYSEELDRRIKFLKEVASGSFRGG